MMINSGSMMEAGPVIDDRSRICNGTMIIILDHDGYMTRNPECLQSVISSDLHSLTIYKDMVHGDERSGNRTSSGDLGPYLLTVHMRKSVHKMCVSYPTLFLLCNQI